MATTFLAQTEQFINAEAEHKDAYLQEILDTINDLMMEWKEAIVSGSKERQDEAIGKINQVRGVLKDYLEKAKEDLNLNSEEMKQVVQYVVDKSPNQEKMKSFQKDFEKESEEIVELLGEKKKHVKRRLPRTGWIQS
jgi:ElaB/YqjD/DUF883 family membrane-anchored ribosome-binding protein